MIVTAGPRPHQPVIAEHAAHEQGVTLTLVDQLAPGDAMVLAAPHEGYLSRANKPDGVELWRT